jgi:maspardin
MAGRSKDDRSAIAKSAEYISFRSAVSLNRQSIRYIRRDYTWKYYDQGPKTVRSPFVFLPPVSGTADVWFRQLLPLSAQGYRCIALEYPCLDNVQEFCEVLTQLLDTLDLKRVHLVGASLGAFLAQVYAEHTANHKRVASLVLVNGFTDTTVFRDVPSPIM